MQLAEGEKKDLQTRSITVDSGCQKILPSAVNPCLGERSVSLYAPDEPYPFIESVSDIPILFIDQDTPIFVGVDGSRDILYEVPATVRDKSLSLGYMKLSPLPQHRPGQITDLVRVDTITAPFTGHTLDINLERSTVMPLIVGSYRLDHYITVMAGESSTRQSSTRHFQIEAGKTFETEFPVFVSEKKYLAFKKKHPPAADIKASEATPPKQPLRVKPI